MQATKVAKNKIMTIKLLHYSIYYPMFLDALSIATMIFMAILLSI